MIDCIDLDNYALTGNVSRYNEDSLTAQQLLMKSARRTKDALHLLKSLYDGVKSMYTTLELNYDNKTEALSIADATKIPFSSALPIRKYYFLFNENSKAFIELAGDIAKVINEGLNAFTEITTKLSNVEGIEDKLKELSSFVDNCYIDIYDDCSYTTLELAGNTACKVNEFITAVNMLEDLAKYINSASKVVITYDSDGEMLITVITEQNEEELLL